ncbi:MAG TPA: 1-acyl-sn-glycerol-3-phosphate acyltransferase [Vicinamibacterales bacterium]|nr:1-acyl-sn-glycerol-3-phosphate acyltransferase [Vicinamibacterales bacterium]
MSTSTTMSSNAKLQMLLADARFPAKYKPILLHFFATYQSALSEAGLKPEAYDHLLCGFVDRMEERLQWPFTFEPYHRQITEPFDYYTFGVEFLRPLVDKRKSSVRGREHLDAVARHLEAGENVIFLANHQTEGDPQAISLLLEDAYPAIGKQMIFAAGERVTTDPLAVPFSMGRNLLCIYSKRYIDHPPEQKHAKQHHNRKTMERMRELLSEGGQCVYVAPSGGRDRPNAQGVVEVAAFDPQSVEMFYLMAQRAGRPSHFHPMALATYDFLPPPETVRSELGETRHITRTGIHLAVGAEIDMARFPGSDTADRHERRVARARHIWQRVTEDYAALGR